MPIVIISVLGLALGFLVNLMCRHGSTSHSPGMGLSLLGILIAVIIFLYILVLIMMFLFMGSQGTFFTVMISVLTASIGWFTGTFLAGKKF